MAPSRQPALQDPGVQLALGTFVKLTRAAQSLTLVLARRIEADQRLTLSQFGVLEALLHLGPLPAGRLAVKLLRSPTNLTTVLDNLERDGLVRRTASSGDRRTRPIELTPAGRERIEAALPAQAQGIRLLMAALTAAEQERLGQLCRKLGRSIAAGP